MNFDEELKAALKRREPPEGFAERVLARAQSPAATRRANSSSVRK